MTIDAYLDSIKARLVSDPIVTSFQVIRERSTLIDGHIRARLTLVEGNRLEFSEYMQRSPTGDVAVITYSYHWANVDNQLIMRWDNAPHFPDLPGFPDHIHDGPTEAVAPGQMMSIFAVLDAIARRIR